MRSELGPLSEGQKAPTNSPEEPNFLSSDPARRDAPRIGGHEQRSSSNPATNAGCHRLKNRLAGARLAVKNRLPDSRRSRRPAPGRDCQYAAAPWSCRSLRRKRDRLLPVSVSGLGRPIRDIQGNSFLLWKTAVAFHWQCVALRPFAQSAAVNAHGSNEQQLGLDRRPLDIR